jgi:hypothetical protein
MTPQTDFPASVRFRDGQRLDADELSAAIWTEAQHRALHVRVLHDTWGVAEGLAIIRVPGRQIVVGPGLAYDLLGRELVLPHAVTFPLPAADALAGWILVIRADDDSFSQAGGGCVVGGQSGVGASGRLAWRAPNAVRLGADVPLAHVRWADQQAHVLADRHIWAQPSRRPHVGWGLVKLSLKDWKAWPKGGTVAGFEAKISSAVAGFTRPPLYFVQRIGAESSTPPPKNAVGPFLSVANAEAAGFVVRVTYPTSDAADWPGEQLKVSLSGWELFWIGIEVTTVGGG